MAVGTSWEAQHACGHTARRTATSHNLSSERVRCQLLGAATDTLRPSDDDFAVRAENPDRPIDSAPWWTDQRDNEPVGLDEHGGDVASSDATDTNGNQR